METPESDFEWDLRKEARNLVKHGVDFRTAQQAFGDQRRVLADDLAHGGAERRYFCFGRVAGAILTVRFTWRGGKVRTIGAGYWRAGRRLYEKGNQVHE